MFPAGGDRREVSRLEGIFGNDFELMGEEPSAGVVFCVFVVFVVEPVLFGDPGLDPELSIDDED